MPNLKYALAARFDRYCESVFHKYTSWALFGFLSCIIPVGLLCLNIIGFQYRLSVIATMTVILTVFCFLQVVWRRHWTWYELGFNFDRWREALPWYLLLLAVCWAGLAGVILKFDFQLMTMTPAELLKVVIVKPILLSAPQEFLFRGVLVLIFRQAFRRIENERVRNGLIILCDTILFAGLHLIYPHNRGLMVFLTCVMGVGFTWIFLHYPILLFATLVHFLVNAPAIAWQVANTQG